MAAEYKFFCTKRFTFSAVSFSVNVTNEPPDVNTTAEDRPLCKLPSALRVGGVVTPAARIAV